MQRRWWGHPSRAARDVLWRRGRHGGRARSRAAAADTAAWQRARRPKTCKLAALPRFRTVIAKQLQQDWSPEQIVGAVSISAPPAEAANRAVPGGGKDTRSRTPAAKLAAASWGPTAVPISASLAPSRPLDAAGHLLSAVACYDWTPVTK